MVVLHFRWDDAMVCTTRVAGSPRRDVVLPRDDKVRIGSRHDLGMTIIILSLRARQGVAIQSEALCVILRRSDGMHYVVAGLPRRYAPRDDKGEKGCGVIWGRCLIGLMDCRVRT